MFICDYVFIDGNDLKLNTFGSVDRAASRRIRDLLKDRQLATVYGYNYVIEFSGFHPDMRQKCRLNGFTEITFFGGQER